MSVDDATQDSSRQAPPVSADCLRVERPADTEQDGRGGGMGWSLAQIGHLRLHLTHHRLCHLRVTSLDDGDDDRWGAALLYRPDIEELLAALQQGGALRQPYPEPIRVGDRWSSLEVEASYDRPQVFGWRLRPGRLVPAASMYEYTAVLDEQQTAKLIAFLHVAVTWFNPATVD